MATRVPLAGLPHSLNSCVLRGSGGEYLEFVQPSGTVAVQNGKTIGSYTYERDTSGLRAVASLSPLGGTFGGAFCYVRHELELVGAPRATADEVFYDVIDKGAMHACTTAQRKVLEEPVQAQIKAQLQCPRAKEPWFRYQ